MSVINDITCIVEQRANKMFLRMNQGWNTSGSRQVVKVKARYNFTEV